MCHAFAYCCGEIPNLCLAITNLTVTMSTDNDFMRLDNKAVYFYPVYLPKFSLSYADATIISESEEGSVAEVSDSEDGDEKQEGEKQDRKKDLEVSISYFRYNSLTFT